MMAAGWVKVHTKADTPPFHSSRFLGTCIEQAYMNLGEAQTDFSGSHGWQEAGSLCTGGGCGGSQAFQIQTPGKERVVVVWLLVKPVVSWQPQAGGTTKRPKISHLL
jgi:hypothetical protein